MTWLNYESTPLILGIVIALLSLVNFFLPKVGDTKKFEKTLNIAIVCLSVLLLIAQDKSSDAATKKADKKLKDALTEQRNQLTDAFNTGTGQVIKATSETATQTQRSAKQQTDAIKLQAKQQTDAIEKQAQQQTDDIQQQATLQYTQLQTTMIGTSTCPDVVIGNLNGGRPNLISVVNQDPKTAHRTRPQVGYDQPGVNDMTPTTTTIACIGHLERTSNLVKCVFQNCEHHLCAECAEFDEGRCAVHGFKNKVSLLH